LTAKKGCDPQVYPNPRLCKALLDRIIGRAHIIETGTDSYRLRRTLEVRKKKGSGSGDPVVAGGIPNLYC
jgi:hypothetical protein